MKNALGLLLSTLFLIGCAANLRFIDRQTGEVHLGQTGSTIRSSGRCTATIGDEKYKGEWIYSPGGGGYSLTNLGELSTISTSATGNGLITMRGNKESYVRCVFNFNTSSNTGIGECRRTDGRLFDVTIKR